MVRLWYQEMKNIHVMDLNDGKVRIRHGEEVPSDFTSFCTLRFFAL